MAGQNQVDNEFNMLEFELKMSRLLWGCMFIFLFLNSCTTILPPLMVSSPGALAPNEWSDYGAFYEYDELRIFTDVLYTVRGWVSFYIVNQKLHILNRKGLQFATLTVPKYSDCIADFSVTLWNRSGNEVPLDLAAIRKKYFETGKIIVPKAEAGCQIGIKITFEKRNLIYAYEHWFERPIPVLKARFSLFYPRNVKYVCKPYGNLSLVDRQHSGPFVGYVWSLTNILPEDDVFENRWHIDRESHVMARIESWYWQHVNYDASDWDGLARKTRELFLSPSILTSKSRLESIIQSLSISQCSAYEKADAILAYVQDKITLDSQKRIRLYSIDIDKVLRDKSGNLVDITVLLKELLKTAGFSTRIYFTRRQNWGGFDGEFPTWLYLVDPLVGVDVDGRELIAYPFRRLMALGEYPFVFNDLQALKIDDGTIAFLPASTSSVAKRTSLATISPGNWKDVQPWHLTYSGQFATFMRSRMNWPTAEKRIAYFRSFIHGYDRENGLEKAEMEKIKRKGEIHVKLACRNTDYKTDRADLSHYSLKPWFRKYLTDYDVTRKVNYTNDMAVVYEDGVLVKNDNNIQCNFHFECVNLDNPLFSSRCFQKETSEGTLLSRELTVKQTDLTDKQMQTIYPDIVKLNRIDESYFVEKR